MWLHLCFPLGWGLKTCTGANFVLDGTAVLRAEQPQTSQVFAMCFVHDLRMQSWCFSLWSLSFLQMFWFKLLLRWDFEMQKLGWGTGLISVITEQESCSQLFPSSPNTWRKPAEVVILLGLGLLGCPASPLPAWRDNSCSLRGRGRSL